MASIEDAIRQATDAINRGDVEGFLGFHTDDVVVHLPGRSPIAGEHRGKERFGELIAGQIQAGANVEIHDVLTSAEHAVVLNLLRLGPPGGQTIEDRQVIVFHHREGRISEVWIYSEDQYQFDEVISRTPR